MFYLDIIIISYGEPFISEIFLILMLKKWKNIVEVNNFCLKVEKFAYFAFMEFQIFFEIDLNF